MKNNPNSRQSGSSLIEVLVAILIVSFGLLALGGMLSFAVQLPKLSAYRAAATSLAAGHIERMRANPLGFAGDSYKETMTYNTLLPLVSPCVYPLCTSDSIATLDKDETNRAIRREFQSITSGMRVTCLGACTALEGEIWVMWQEPNSFAAFSPGSSDECPDPSAAPSFTPFTAPLPRCVHIRFKL